MNIYNKMKRLEEIEEYLFELGGVIPEVIEGEEEFSFDIEKELTIRQEEFKQTALEYCQNIRLLEGEIALAQEEAKRISGIAANKQNLVEKLKEAVKNATIAFGEKDPKKDLWRIDLGTFKLGTRTTESVELDLDVLPNEFKRVAVSELSYEEYVSLADSLGRDLKHSVDALKTPIKEKLKAGEVIEGATIKPNIGLNLR